MHSKVEERPAGSLHVYSKPAETLANEIRVYEYLFIY